MYIRVFQDTLIGGHWTGIGVGNFDPETAQHLIDIGVAESYEVKVSAPSELKKKAPQIETSSASQPAPVSPEPTAKKRRGRPRKSSQ
jgi:hypothetical protein